MWPSPSAPIAQNVCRPPTPRRTGEGEKMSRSKGFQWLVLSCAAVLLVLGCTCASAQVTTASLGGTVTDASGASIPDARVTILNSATGFTQTANTGGNGAFLLPRLPVGNYQLRVEKSGFGTYVQDGIALTVGQQANEIITLQVGALNEKVEVSANAELVTTGTATLGQLVGEKQIVDLPLDGRMVQNLVFISAGTINVTNNYCGLGCEGGVYPGEQYAAVNGGGPNGVNYQLDGAGHNDTYLNMNLPFPNPDAVEEFNLETSNISAEYGNAISGIVNVVTKSGTNEIHGSAFEFVRNGSMNARNFFAPTHDELTRNQFGGSVGGPIVKNRLFYFGTYQGTRINIAPEGQIAFVPTEAERKGDFSSLLSQGTQLVDPVTSQPYANNQIPTSQLSPVSQYLLQHIPLPNGPGSQLTYANATTVQNEDQFMTKFDYNAGKSQLSGRYFFTDYRQPPTLPSAGNVLQATAYGSAVRVQNMAITHSYTMSPALLLSTWFGWNQQSGGTRSSAPFSFQDAGVAIAHPTIPELVVDVNGGFYLNTNHFSNSTRGDWSIRETVTWMKGGHELHFGGEALRIRAPQANQYLQNGEYTFSDSLSGDNTADFLLGRVSQFVQGGGIFLNLVGTKWSGFVQDNWRVNSRLTLNLGVRWDPYFPYTEREGRNICFDPGATTASARYPNAPLGLLYGGSHHDPGCPANSVNSNIGNLGPRVGFAYRLTQDGKTSVRGGIGMYYQPPETVSQQDVAGVAPFGPIITLNDVSFQDPYGSAGIPNPFPANYGPRTPGSDAPIPLPATIYGVFPKDFRIPEVTTWNLTVERQLPAGLVLRAAYLANKGTHLFGTTDQKPTQQANPAVYVPGNSTIGNTQDRRLYPNFGLIGLMASVNNSNYNALQLNLEKRFSHGLQVLANYTWSKSLDDFAPTNNFAGTDPFNRRFDYGRSDDDIPNNFKFSAVWEIPHMGVGRIAGAILNGWQANTIVGWQSGFVFNVISGLDNSFSGTGWGPEDRADFLGGKATLCQSRPHDQLITEFFDTSKFTANAIGTFGNFGKNNMRGPRVANTDFSMLRNIKITEHKNLQLRAEFFNVFNHVNFGQPDSNWSDGPGLFGAIFSARDPRILQFASRFEF